LETSTKTEYKRKANPFSAENYIVCQGWQRGTLGAAMAGGITPADYFPEGLDREERIAACKKLPKDWFTKHLQNTKLLVGQNIKFDLLYAIANPNSNPEANLFAWMEFINRGGMIWDIQLAEYMLAGMEQSSHMLALDEIAPSYGGNVKLDEVKTLWEAGVDTIDIPEDLLMRYLAGREGSDGFEEGDIGNTERVFRGQWDKAKQSGQLRSILLGMGALVFTIECERNGMAVDKQLGLELAEKLAAKLAEASLQLEKYLPEGLPFEFNWNSRFHKSALIFGGKVKYDAPAPVLDDDGNLTYYQKKELHYLLVDGTTTPCAPGEPCFGYDGGRSADDYSRFAGGKNKGELKTKQVTVPDLERGHKTRIEPHYYTFEGFTKPDPTWESKSDPGVYSTASEIMEELTSNTDVPFLKTLGEVVKMTKDLGTYFITTDEDGNQKGMLTLVQLDGIIHHMLNHTSTVTARLSSSNPNLQNIPKGQKSDAKTLFKSRWGEDGVIIQSDFSSLEVYVQAILTRAAQLIADLRAGVDMHCMRLAAKEGMQYDEVLQLCKGEGVDPEVQSEWDYKRTGAKVFSFQRAYGAGTKKIAKSTGMSEEDTQALADAENARYPEIEPYFEQKAIDIRKSRIPTGMIVQHPEIPGLQIQLGKGYSVTPDGKLYCYREHPSPKWLIERGKERAGFMPTEIKNYEVQGTGGEFAKAAMWLSVRAFYHYRNFDGLALLVNQVHDAEYADAHKKVRAKAAALLHVCMEEASTFMEWWFKWELPLGVPSDTVWGSSMAEESKITSDVFEQCVDKLRPWVRKRFIGNHVPTFEQSL
jgi:DNA polymerase I-like protein with 3'-5' exonuclease and polymerase domains